MQRPQDGPDISFFFLSHLSCSLLMLQCGANCTFKIPIVGKTINIALPPCPISPAAMKGTKSITLPGKSPIPLTIDAKGTITLTNGDKHNTVIADVSVNVKLDPSSEEDEEQDVFYYDMSKMFE